MTRHDAHSLQQHQRQAVPPRRQPIETLVIEDEEDLDLFEDEQEATSQEPHPLVLGYWNNRFAPCHTGELPRAASPAPQTTARPGSRPHAPRPRWIQHEADEDDLEPRTVARPARRRRSGVLYTVAGVLSMASLVVGLNALGMWWQGVQDDWHYGRPRTYQLDAVVGHHHDSAAHPTHLIALNLDGHVEIIEIAAGDPSAARVYPGPLLTGPNKDEVVVTLSVADVDHDGTPDLVVHVGASEFVLFNNGHDDQFHPGQPTK